MNFSKKFKRENDDDDVVIIEPSVKRNSNEFCQEFDQSCREFSSVVCLHCHRTLCYEHLEFHRQILLNERDELINEYNRHLENLIRWRNFPKEFLQENYQRTFSFVQRLALEKFIDFEKFFVALNESFEPNRKLLDEQKSVSVVQIEKLRQSFVEFEEKKRILFDQLIKSLPSRRSFCSKTNFQLSMIDFPIRQVSLSIQQTSSNEFVANDDLLIISDRDHLLLFDLNQTFDETSIPEIIEWKIHRDGKILDLQFCFDLNKFFFLTEEKFFSFQRSSMFNCLRRFTSTPWAFTIFIDSIYFLYKNSLDVERWIFDGNFRSIEISQQWRSNEILPQAKNDQHFRSIRSNPNQNQLAILIENDECQWRIALFDRQMKILCQTDFLHGASTIDWNLNFTFVNDRQIFIIDATTNSSYVVTIDENFQSSIEFKNFSDKYSPVNACTIISERFTQLLVKMTRPNSLNFLQI